MVIDMRYIDKDEYDMLYKEYIKSQENDAVDDVHNTWDWHSQKQKEFDKKLAQEGIAKQK